MGDPVSSAAAPEAGALWNASGIYSLFADVLDYPGPEIFRQARDLALRIAASDPEAAQTFEEFESALKSMRLSELEEIYTSAFDLRPDRTTNLGCHIFGEDVRRNIFMAQLKQRLESRHIPLGSELPDHLSLILQLLAAEDSAEEARALIEDCLAPAVARILSTFQDDSNPYAPALRTLRMVLNTASAGVSSPAPA